MKWIRFSSFLIFIYVCSAIFTPFTFAHVEGQSWEVVLKEYKVDVGYDPSTFVAGETVRFDFSITKEATGESVDFGDVWVRITEGEKTVFASGIHRPNIGKAGMTFTFPEDGEYTLSVRFEKDSTNIAETTFPMTVQKTQETPEPKKANWFAWFGWGVAVICLVRWGLLRVNGKVAQKL